MKKIEIQLSNAVKAHKKADKAGKALLEDLLGSDFLLKQGSVTDRVKTFEDALDELGIEWEPSPDLTRDELAYQKLKIIARALNEGWKPDWTNHSEGKYYPYFKDYRPGSGFAFFAYVNVCTATGLGSRLVFKTRKLAEYAGTQFCSIYNDFLTPDE